MNNHIDLPQRGSNTRRLTISSKGFARKKDRYISFPELRLAEKWLLQNGFKSGHMVDVACEDGRLVITVAQAKI